MGYFTFNDVDSRTLGIEIEEAPHVPKPVRRAEVYSVPGRNGSVIVPQDAWDDVQITYHCWAPLPDNTYSLLGALAERFTTDGYALLYDSYTRQYRLAYLNVPMDFEVIQESFVRFDLVFMAHPQLYLAVGLEEQEIITGEPLTINNFFRHTAWPLFHFITCGTLSITYDDGSTQEITISDSEDSTDSYVDCETGSTYEYIGDKKFKSYRISVTGTEFPVLRPQHPVTLSWSGSGRAFIQTRFWEL